MLRMLTMGLLTQVIRPESLDKASSIILRLPGLFILDYYYQTYSKDEVKNIENRDYTSFINTFMVFQATLFILLPLKPLMKMYKHYFSAALIGYAELYSRHYVSTEHSKEINNIGLILALSSKFNVAESHFSYIHHHIEALCLHVIIAAAVAYLLNVTCRVRKAFLSVYTVPVIARLINMPLEYLDVLHKFCGIVMGLCILVYCLSVVYSFIYRFFKQLRNVYRNLKSEMFQNPIEIHIQHILCDKFYVMPQFFVFWCSLLAVQLCRYWYPQIPHIGTTMLYPSEKRWYLLFLYAVSEICASPLSLVASCITIMYTSWAVLSFTTVLAKGPGLGPNLARLGTGEGVTMALLSLQTGLVDLPMPQRIGAMSVILFIVLGSLLQSMHELVEPTLLALCTSQTHSLARHARVLLVCLFLFVFPLYMTIFLCRLFDVDFWTLVVVSTCAFTSVQVLGALTVYGLFMYDSLQKDSGWESLDDVVYIARAIIRVLEFIVAVLVVGAGVRESIVLSSEGRPWSWLNGSVLAIHFYFNVYQRLQSGWRSFLLRREAARKIHSLPSASAAQLLARAHDVCAICYMEMRGACVTPCMHLFHAPCLKKWLYVQDRCPLCSAQIVFTRAGEEGAAKGPEPAGTAAPAQGAEAPSATPSAPPFLFGQPPFGDSGCRYRRAYVASATAAANDNYLRDYSDIDSENGNGNGNGNGDYVNADYVNAHYGNANYGNANYGNADYGNADYGNADYGNADYGNADYSNADYGNANYGNANYGSADYGNAYFAGQASQFVGYRRLSGERPIIAEKGEIIKIPANFQTCDCFRFPAAYRMAPSPLAAANYANGNVNTVNANEQMNGNVGDERDLEADSVTDAAVDPEADEVDGLSDIPDILR